MTSGRLVALAFGLVAVVGAVLTWDASKGRVPETSSTVIAAVLAATINKQCARDVSAALAPVLPLGIARGQAETLLAAATIRMPRPWFWKPQRLDRTSIVGDRLEMRRTIKATIFGSETLILEGNFAEDKLAALKARVECSF
ncbi:MAG: hypothetical protein ACRC56_13205 [Bosea sp. (in: a-proteobacteria)]